jgi:phage terminase small subunit
MGALTEKQKRFCDFYIKFGNATEAAIQSGYSKKTAKQIGQQNLSKVYLRSYIDSRLEKLESTRIADATEVMQYLTSVMRGEKTEEQVLVAGLEVKKIEKKMAGREQVKAAELLAKRYGLLTENIKLEGEGAIQIVNDIPRNADKP